MNDITKAKTKTCCFDVFAHEKKKKCISLLVISVSWDSRRWTITLFWNDGPWQIRTTPLWRMHFLAKTRMVWCFIDPVTLQTIPGLSRFVHLQGAIHLTVSRAIPFPNVRPLSYSVQASVTGKGMEATPVLSDNEGWLNLHPASFYSWAYHTLPGIWPWLKTVWHCRTYTQWKLNTVF